MTPFLISALLIHLLLALQGEQREFEDFVKANGEFESQKQNTINRFEEIKAEVARLSAQIQNEGSRLSELEAEFEGRTRRECLESALSEEKIGLHVSSVAQNVTKFSFKYIDPADWERRFSISIDVATNRYRIHSCEPMIPQLSSLLDHLNEDNNFYAFLQIYF